MALPPGTVITRVIYETDLPYGLEVEYDFWPGGGGEGPDWGSLLFELEFRAWELYRHPDITSPAENPWDTPFDLEVSWLEYMARGDLATQLPDSIDLRYGTHTRGTAMWA